MSTLSNEQRISLTEQLAELFSYEEPDKNYPGDLAHEAVDGWLPYRYDDIVNGWIEAGRPAVDELDLIGDKHRGSVYHIMTVALYEQALGWVYQLWRDYSEEDVTNAGQALTACNTYLAVRGANTYLPRGLKQGRVMSW